MRLSDVDIWELAGFQNQLIFRFMLKVDVVGGVSGSFVNNTNTPAFRERKLVGLGVNGYREVRFHDHARGMVPNNMFREHLTCFANVKSFTFFYIRVDI